MAKFDDDSTILIENNAQAVCMYDSYNKKHTFLMDFIDINLKHKVAQVTFIRNQYFSPIVIPSFIIQDDKRLYAKYFPQFTVCH